MSGGSGNAPGPPPGARQAASPSAHGPRWGTREHLLRCPRPIGEMQGAETAHEGTGSAILAQFSIGDVGGGGGERGKRRLRRGFGPSQMPGHGSQAFVTWAGTGLPVGRAPPASGFLHAARHLRRRSGVSSTRRGHRALGGGATTPKKPRHGQQPTEEVPAAINTWWQALMSCSVPEASK